MNTQPDPRLLSAQMALINWEFNLKQADTFFRILTDEDFQRHVAPGKNRGFYLVGHLIAEHDEMAELVGLSRTYSKYDTLFMTMPDTVGATYPNIEELRNTWQVLHASLTVYFRQMSPKEWFERHTHISPEDFLKEPHRNKLAVLTNRNIHFGYHLGQLALLKQF